ncbi:MAG: FapA family protein, partial [Chloroflexota bacterium]|nr:FapA family protein [Chloroflexota bacterium]
MEELNTVDWYELFAHDQILSGETLVEAIPATEGTMGHTVLGADLPQTPGEPVDLAALAGDNTEVDGNILKATVSGEPVLNGEKVEVTEIMEVPDDVDFSTGNIRFPESVEVKGGVRPGF